MKYTINKDGQVFGPYSKKELLKYISEGSIYLTDMASENSSTNLTPLYKLLKKSSNLSKNFNISRDGSEYGPYAYQDMIAYFKSGQLLGTDLVWTEGMEEWVTLESVLNNEKLEWVIIQKEEIQYGPFSLKKLRKLIQNHNFVLNDLCWFEGIDEWITLKKLCQIFNIPIKFPVTRGEESFGPYSLKQIKQFIREGNLLSTDLILGEDNNWISVEELIQKWESEKAVATAASAAKGLLKLAWSMSSDDDSDDSDDTDDEDMDDEDIEEDDTDDEDIDEDTDDEDIDEDTDDEDIDEDDTDMSIEEEINEVDDEYVEQEDERDKIKEDKSSILVGKLAILPVVGLDGVTKQETNLIWNYLNEKIQIYSFYEVLKKDIVDEALSEFESSTDDLKSEEMIRKIGNFIETDFILYTVISQKNGKLWLQTELIEVKTVKKLGSGLSIVSSIEKVQSGIQACLMKLLLNISL
ncbi:MAG: DUF4339 domain-containing protein [Leptospiraceae bacterium]|nr:DUF4339 domain-containing protein [Leptospiraceae bacterium]